MSYDIGCCQDGYAVRCSDGAGDFQVEFDALAGMPPGRLSVGKVAYIGTGAAADAPELSVRLPALATCHPVQAAQCQRARMQWCR